MLKLPSFCTLRSPLCHIAVGGARQKQMSSEIEAMISKSRLAAKHPFHITLLSDRPFTVARHTVCTELVSEAASLVAEFPSFFLTGFTQPWAHIVVYICRSTVATALHCPCYFGSREWGVPYFGTNCFGCPSSVRLLRPLTPSVPH